MCTSCWLRGGYITHHCGGLFICCERFAQPLSATSGEAQARNIENGWTINFGPNSVFGGGDGGLAGPDTTSFEPTTVKEVPKFEQTKAK